MSAAMLEVLLESSLQGCKLRVVVRHRRVVVGSCASLSAEQCAATQASVAGRRGSRCTPMVSHMASDVH